MTQAIVTSIYRRANASAIAGSSTPLKQQIPALEKMLWGGTVVLLVDHIIHGEIFTFSLRELLTVGVPMSVVLTVIWAVWAVVKSRRKKTALETQ